MTEDLRPKGGAKTASASEASGEDTIGYESLPENADPEDFVLCGDGKWYRRRVVSGVAAMVGTASLHPGSLRRAERIEAAIHAAIMKAVSEGVQVGSPELTAVIDAARDAAMEDIS